VKINTLDVAAAPRGAAFPGVRSPWTILKAPGLSAMGMSHVLTPNPATDTRKQYVHKTRVNAGGDCASGPHPEREPA